MSNTPRPLSPAEISSIFTRLNPQDVEQFYTSYQRWLLQQQLAQLQDQINTLHQQIAANHEHLQQVQPSPVALAALNRLQANGVNDVDLLDHMLERGDTWLDRTMQRLTYCEQFDFIRGNYTDWCEHALEGAYDWIDSMHHASLEASSSTEESIPTENDTAGTPDMEDTHTPLDEVEITEEIFLQKLMSDDIEEEALLLATTLKRSAIQTTPEEQQIAPSEQIEAQLVPPALEELPTAAASETSTPPLLEYTEVTPPSEQVYALASGDGVDTPPLEQVTASEQIELPPTAESSDTPCPADAMITLSEAPIAPSPTVHDTQEKHAANQPPDIPEGALPLASTLSEKHIPLTQPSSQEPTYTTEHTPWQWDKPLSSEIHTMANQTNVSAQPGNKQPASATKPKRKRSFLQRLFAPFSRKP